MTVRVLRPAAAVAAAAALSGCATVVVAPPALTVFDRQGCAAAPELSRAASLTPEKPKAEHAVTTPVGPETPCLAGADGPTPYLLYALPSDPNGKTLDVGGVLEASRIFAPRAALLDAQGRTTRELGRDQFLYRGDVYSARFTPRAGEAYLLVTAAPDLTGKPYQSIAISTATTSVYTGYGVATWTSGVDAGQLRTFSYDGTVRVSVFDSAARSSRR